MKRFYLSIALFSALVLLASCATYGKYLKAEEAKAVDPDKTYTLILYGGRHADDFETIAILDIEGDGVEIVPRAPEFDYEVTGGLSAKEAEEAGRHFVSFHPSFRNVQASRVVDASGRVIAYELRPLYQPFVLGMMDVLLVYYWQGAPGKVNVRVELNYAIERRLRRQDAAPGQ
jgi:hypothetical protein